MNLERTAKQEEPSKDSKTLELTEALDTIENLMGAFNTPLCRLKFPSDFQDETIAYARTILKKHGRLQ